MTRTEQLGISIYYLIAFVNRLARFPRLGYNRFRTYSREETK